MRSLVILLVFSFVSSDNVDLKGCQKYEQNGTKTFFDDFHISVLKNNQAVEDEWLRMKVFYIGSYFGPHIGISDKKDDSGITFSEMKHITLLNVLFKHSFYFEAGFHFQRNVSEIYKSHEDYIYSRNACVKQDASGLFSKNHYIELNIIFKKGKTINYFGINCLNSCFRWKIYYHNS